MGLSLFIANLQAFSVKLQLILFKWLYYQLMDITLKAFRGVFTFNLSKNFIFSVSRIKMPSCIIFSPVLTMAVALEAFPLQICIWFFHFNKNSAHTVKNWKLYCKQLLLYILLLLHLPLQYWMFVCAASIIYNAVFILISTATPTEENYVFFISFFFHRYWRFTEQQGKTGNHLI